MRNTKTMRFLAAAAAISMLATACSGGSDEENTNADGDTVITWWHNSNTGSGKDYYDQIAADFEAANEGVEVKVEALQHEDMTTKLEAAFQSGEMPDIYMERGGGELADHVEAGLTRDLTEDAAGTIAKLGGNVGGWTVDDRVYSLPFSIGVVGFWYNKALFEQAGIESAPTTMAELNDAVQKLKDAGIEPISVGAGDKWPAAHYWYYCTASVLAGRSSVRCCLS